MTVLPQLRLESDTDDASDLKLVFEPDPNTWRFDDGKGSRDQLREELRTLLVTFVKTAKPDAVFDEDAQQKLRTSIRHLLLTWIGFRGLHVPASG